MARISRRTLLAASLLPGPVLAQGAWPSRPVTLIVPWAPGGSNDVAARLIAPHLEARFGQPFVIENRPGGGGSLGMGMVARARPDGSTMLVSSASNHVFHALIQPDLGYDVQQSLAGVAMLVDVPNVLAVTNGLDVNSVQELIAKVRAAGGMSFGSSGVGSSNHLAGELFRLRTGLDLTHVPYRGGGQAISDLIAGTVPMAFLNLPTVLGPAQSGRAKILAVGTDQRVSSQPNIPTMQEQGVPDYSVRSWTGLFTPRGTPQPIIDSLAAALKDILQEPALKARLLELGSEPIWMDPAATDRFVKAEFDRWGPVVKAANVKLE
ncbi:tripartite tricarboxylate transporter substrate binding protein [Siccirubricoccus sp. KC 17139]|uniref:Tripartite tricarboxylate transporter substrate binding protein n=1 Tax=Siccirubricoccus soli TaxID=2899147 RepID=A0ABT1D377_9PROT|nr:tripartite tricarboxylate transporter substrate binding protein [Siccirubricoccus soli]MCO6416344.1 tripartite tricarboxylate transporter substrate binding protein [Siccirubricoccus soli]MCP2682478.1 tripartite tricarboxylate transporter substrate binding protein [Siccirubricoccus soli]